MTQLLAESAPSSFSLSLSKGDVKLKSVRIQNYRSCHNVPLTIDSLHALVGANNAGKSTILRALDFFFNPSTGKIDAESFWNCDPNLTIRVEAIFGDITEDEKAVLLPYLRPDMTFYVARTAALNPNGDDTSESKFTIGQHYCKPHPKHEWLREGEITGSKIDEWWARKESLTVNGFKFSEFVGGSKPSVGKWKEKAKEFADRYLRPEDYEDIWTENPKGYAGVLKGSLPHFILVPAVRDLTDEAKATKTNPFGRLLYTIIENVTQEQRQELAGFVKNLAQRLNRDGGSSRLPSISQAESRLNEVLKEYMECDLEIEFQPPTLEVLLTTPKLFADDGFRNMAENKGHGLQRSIIFSILRCYSELVTGRADRKKKNMILSIEEPEIYMHPQAQRAIRRVLRKIAKEGDQVIFSTHSALLVDVAAFDEIMRVEAICEVEEGKKTVRTKVWQLPMVKMIADLNARHPHITPTADSIRELYSNAYHPNRSEGFFAKKVILVEGPTEQYTLPIYAAALGHPLDSLNISVVDCGGKGQMDRLYRIFNELGIPTYILFDYDKDSSNSNALKKSRELLTLAGEPTEPPPATLVSERIACFPRKWELDLALEITSYSLLESMAHTTLGLRDESSRPLVARFIARQLAAKVPPEIPPSIRRILEKAMALPWLSSCLSTPVSA